MKDRLILRLRADRTSARACFLTAFKLKSSDGMRCVFTHPSVSTFDRVPFQVTDELFFAMNGDGVAVYFRPSQTRCLLPRGHCVDARGARTAAREVVHGDARADAGARGHRAGDGRGNFDTPGAARNGVGVRSEARARSRRNILGHLATPRVVVVRRRAR